MDPVQTEVYIATPGALILIVVIDGYGESGILGILCLFSVVNTDLKREVETVAEEVCNILIPVESCF